jgi:hypothetical protein
MSLLIQIAARSIAKLLCSLRFPRFADESSVRGYRPERHYMRGPGPQWHAKHDAPAGASQVLPARLSKRR